MILNPDHQMVLESKRQLSLSLINSTPVNEVNLNVLKDNLYFLLLTVIIIPEDIGFKNSIRKFNI